MQSVKQKLRSGLYLGTLLLSVGVFTMIASGAANAASASPDITTGGGYACELYTFCLNWPGYDHQITNGNGNEWTAVQIGNVTNTWPFAIPKFNTAYEGKQVFELKLDGYCVTNLTNGTQYEVLPLTCSDPASYYVPNRTAGVQLVCL
jgi:hypothetical protein